MKPVVWCALLALALAGCGQSCTVADGEGTSAPSVDCNPVWMRDATGGVLVLRGANVGGELKWSSDRLPLQDQALLVRLRDEIGLDAIRLLVFWEAIEPYPGIYDEGYLDSIREIVDAAETARLHVVVDMHQDLYGRGFGHAGAPRWTCPESNYASFTQPEVWQLGYIEPEVNACFDRFWSDAHTRAAFQAAWSRLAETLRGSPAILGYEILNEPWWGSSTPREFDREIAPAFYAEAIDVIRLVDPEPFIAIEPAPTASVGAPSELRPPERERLVYAPHMYPATVELGPGYDGNAAKLRAQVNVVCGDAERMDLPVVFGELGVRRDVMGARGYLEDVYDTLDEARTGAFYWDVGYGGPTSYALWDEAGAPSLQANAIARPYPRRVAGEPVRWSWEAALGKFTAEWNEDGSAQGETIFMAPRLAFPDGLDLVLDGGTRDPAEAVVEDGEIRVPQVGGARRIELTRRHKDDVAQP